MKVLPIIVAIFSCLTFMIVMTIETRKRVDEYGNGHAKVINYLFDKVQELEKK